MEKMTGYEFIARYRPDGKGHIIISDFAGNVSKDIEFTEIVCDSCNAEILPNDYLWADDHYANCETCHNLENQGRSDYSHSQDG